MNQANILIVDDTPENLRLLAEMLTARGYTIRPATSGTLALSGARARLPDLILLDIHMPGVNGFEVCRRLKAEDATKNVPIIFISALSDTRDKVHAFENGGVDYITKPFQEEEVLARIKTHLKISRLEKKLKTVNHKLKQRVEEQSSLNRKLREAMNKVRLLRGLLPICSYCKKIRDDDGYWHQIENYIDAHSEARFSHSICRDCFRKHYPDMSDT